MERKNHIREIEPPVEREKAFLAAHIDDTNKRIGEVSSRFNATVKEYGPCFARVIFQGEIPIYDFLVANRELTPLLAKAKKLDPAQQFFNHSFLGDLQRQDLFSLKLGGFWNPNTISLLDIERLAKKLTHDDLMLINSIFHQPWIFKVGEREAFVLKNVSYLAIQAALDRWHNRESKVPYSLKPLAENVCAYFDYLVENLLDFSNTNKSDVRLMRNFIFPSILPEALAIYLVARLGITPASATKICLARAINSDIPNFGWQALIERMERQFRESYKQDGLPRHLQKYQHYLPDIDERVALLLKGFYETDGLTSEGKLDGSDSAERLLKNLNVFSKSVNRRILSSPQRSVELDMPEGHVVSSLTVTQQNRQTLVVILHFDKETHLTLEINHGDKNMSGVYGMPPELSVEVPFVSDLLVCDVLERILSDDLAGARKHDITQIERVARQVWLVPAEIVSEPRPVHHLEPKRRNWSKADKVLTPIRSFVSQFQRVELPEMKNRPVGRQNRVVHSKQQILDLLGKRVPEKDIRWIEGVIRRFEYGQVKIERLAYPPGYFKLRAGDYRIILRGFGKGRFELSRIADREEVYDKIGGLVATR